MKHTTAWTAGGLVLASATLASMMTANADSFQRVDASRADARSADAAPPVHFDYLLRDPLVIYNLSGATLLGDVHQQLTLYDDGTAVCSEIDPLANRAGSVQVEALEAGAVRWFLDELILWGAHLLEDDTSVALDTPMATMTMLFKERNGRVDAHTFSYYPVVAEGNAAEVDRVVQAFIAEYFADGSDGDWSGIDPLQRRLGAQGIDPSRRGRNADEIEPAQRGKQAVFELVPKKRGLDAQEIEPSQRGREAQGIDPTPRGRRAQHIDPAKR